MVDSLFLGLVRPPREDDDGPVALPRIGDDDLPLTADSGAVRLKRLVPFACGKGHLCEGDVEVGLEDLEEALGEEPL